MQVRGSLPVGSWLVGAALFGSLSASCQAGATSSPSASDETLRFDLVSIREDKSSLDPMRNPIVFGPTADGYRLHGAPINFAVIAAYVASQGANSGAGYLNYGQIVGMPPEILNTRYDIVAKVSESEMPRWQDPAQQPAMLRAMLQAMLAERFKLVVHRELKEQPIFDLIVAKGSPNFKPSQGSALAELQKEHPRAFTSFGGVITANGAKPGETMYFGVSMPALGVILTNMAGRPIADKTGLTGRYDLSYQIELPPLPASGSGPLPPLPDVSLQLPSIMSQLGLKLVPARGPVEYLVIDHIEAPSEN